MRTPGDPDQPSGLGRKVEKPKPPEGPEWKYLGNDHWANKKGQRGYAPETPPPAPRKLTPSEEFFEMFGKEGGLFPWVDIQL